MRERECIFDIIVLVDDGRSRFGCTKSGNCSDFDCRDFLLIFLFKSFRRLDWRTDVNEGRWLLGDTGARDEAIDNSLHLGSSGLAKIHFDIPVEIIEVID